MHQNNISGSRLQSIDLLRGIVMVIMAIDHVRVYAGLPAGGPTAGIFFTRWITHFCAPSFVFLAGASAFLFLQKSGSKEGLAKFLVIRGLLLVFLELTAIRFFWMFNLNYDVFVFAGVIWMLGWCMVILAGFVWFRPTTLAIAGVVMIFGQNIFKFIPGLFPESVQPAVSSIWVVFYPSALTSKSGAALLSGISGMPHVMGISIFYVLIPWIGLMMAGYGFGQIFKMQPDMRKKLCLSIGLSAIALFVIAGTLLILFDNSGDSALPFMFRLLGQQKYPPSQLYLLMTIGPLIALIPWAEKLNGRFADAMVIIGKVPMFYYLSHILLIHLSAFVVNLAISGNIHQEWYTTAPFVGMSEDVRWGLPTLYMVWLIDVCILFGACKWYAHYKAAHPEKYWLKYI